MRNARIGVVCLAMGLIAACGDDDGMIVIDPDGSMGDGGVPLPDAGTRDSGPAVDGSVCGVGIPCSMARGCASGVCQENLGGELGSVTDPIQGFAMTSVPAPLFGSGDPSTDPPALGYCMPQLLNLTGNPSCDPADEASCPACSTCVGFGANRDGLPARACLRECTPSLTEDVCPASYACDLGLGVCLDGCTTDDQCRISRRDTDMNGDIEGPAAPGMTSADQLVWDASANHRCDLTTNLCRHDGTAGVSAGATCGWDGDCEADGECLYDLAFEDADDGDPTTVAGRGYCTKLGCDLTGNDCAAGGKCQARGLGEPACLAPCQVGANTGATTDADYIYNPAAACRPGYACVWDGTSPATDTENGGCLPGNFNAVRVANIGAECAEDSECYSPLGQGFCDTLLRGDTARCTVQDCQVPLPAGFPVADLCGANATCIQFPSSATFCRETCATSADCGAGEACIDGPTVTSLGIAAAEAICTPFCFGETQVEADATCKAGEVCADGFMPGMALGSCQTP